jgi:excisionase family DNA binding protein
MPDVLAHSIPEAAKIAGVGRSFLYEEIRAGRLIARKARGRTLILHRDLVDYLSDLPTRGVSDSAAA